MNSQSDICQSSQKQWIAGLAAASILFSPTVDISWISNPGLDLVNFGSAMRITAPVIIGAILGAILADIFGRKRTLLATLIFVIPRLVYIIFENAEWVWILRIFIGFSSGITCTVVPLYISEISCTNNRGKLMVLQLLAYLIGVAITWTIMAFHNVFQFNLIVYTIISSVLLVISVLFHGIILALFPETPHYLNSKKRYQEAAESLAFFRGINHVKIREDASSIPLDSQTNGQSRRKLSEIMQSKNLKNLAIIFSLIVTRWFSGQYRSTVIITHLFRTVARISSRLDPIFIINLGTCGTEFIVVIFTILAIGVLQRKISLIFVLIICIIAAIISFPCFNVNLWVLLVVFLVQHLGHIILVGVGLAYAGEFFSTNIRAVAIAVIISFETLIRNLFVMTENMLFYSEMKYLPPIIYFYGAVFIFALLFVLIVFPKINNVRNFDIAIDTSAGRSVVI